MTAQTGRTGNVLRKGASELCNRAWWVFLIGGVASVVFGILALVNPGLPCWCWRCSSPRGCLSMAPQHLGRARQSRQGWLVGHPLLGIAGVLAGGYALLNPPVSMIVFVYVVAFIAMFIGCHVPVPRMEVPRANSQRMDSLPERCAVRAVRAARSCLIRCRRAVGGLSHCRLGAPDRCVANLVRIPGAQAPGPHRGRRCVMKCTLRVAAFLQALVFVFGSGAAGANTWPQEVTADEGTIIEYQPQPESLNGNVLKGRAAMSIELKDGSDPVSGHFLVRRKIETERRAGPPSSGISR